MVRHSGSFTDSGDGSTMVFYIPHGESTEPYYANADAKNQDTLGIVHDGNGGNDPLNNAKSFAITANGNHIVLTYGYPPVLGTNNLQWYWTADFQ